MVEEELTAHSLLNLHKVLRKSSQLKFCLCGCTRVFVLCICVCMVWMCIEGLFVFVTSILIPLRWGRKMRGTTLAGQSTSDIIFTMITITIYHHHWHLLTGRLTLSKRLLFYTSSKVTIMVWMMMTMVSNVPSNPFKYQLEKSLAGQMSGWFCCLFGHSIYICKIDSRCWSC